MARVGYSVPILRVKDVERAVRFYELLGFTAT
jgi:catechol 2,3-dioxygenase-like lactoylglutathione lyase family enzyme